MVLIVTGQVWQQGCYRPVRQSPVPETKMRRYSIPPTRLPFVNTEIAEIKVAGQVRLVSSIWGGKNGGRIYIFDPNTGKSVCRYLPDGIPGAYMLQTGPDGRLYLGCGNGSLAVYDPKADRFKVLVSGKMRGITWGGCVTDSLVVFSANPGHACVYNWRKRKLLRVFKPLDSAKPTALYAHSVLECPDGKILLGVNAPQARFILLDPVTLKAESHTPAVLRGQTWTRCLTFLDTGRLALSCNNEILVLRYPSFELSRRIAAPAGRGLGRFCLLRRHIYAIGSGGDLYRINPGGAKSKWELVSKRFIDDGFGAILHALSDRYVCAITSAGRFMRYDTRSRKVFRRNLNSTGRMETQAMCVVPQIGKAFGAPYINQRFWEMDLTTGRGRDLGRAAPGGGQINCMVWDEATERLLMGSYTTCTVTAFDPKASVSWPDNPRVLAKVGHEQMRPKSMVHDGRDVWMTSSAKYGRLGGALSRINPRTGKIRVWRNIVHNQTPGRLVINPAARQVYFATGIQADGGSAPPTERTAQLVAFNIDTLKIDRRQTVREGADMLCLMTVLPSGKVLGIDEGPWTLFIWDPATGSIENLGKAPDVCPGYVTVGPDGKIYASVGSSIGTLTLTDKPVSFKPLRTLKEGICRFPQIHGNMLYYVTVPGNKLCAIPLK